MTRRERDERARAFFREAVPSQPHSPYRRCAYCSGYCYGRVCRGHRDLLRLDPNMYEARGNR